MSDRLRTFLVTSAWGQTQKFRACPLHVGFSPKPGRFGAPAKLSEKGQIQT
jgi:hypothetical protein